MAAFSESESDSDFEGFTVEDVRVAQEKCNRINNKSISDSDVNLSDFSESGDEDSVK